MLTTGLQWYVTAHTGRSTSDIVMAQAGLELLAYAHQVIPGRISAAGFDRLPASDAITLMLSDLGLDTDVPEALKDLRALAKERRLTGPECVTLFHNATVHPPIRRPHANQSEAQILIEMRDLSIFYLEHALLRTLGYDALVRHRLHGWGHGPGTASGREE